MYLSAIFPGSFSRQEERFLQTNVKKIIKSGSSACSYTQRPQIFFSRIVSSEGLVYNFFFFRTAVLGNYSALDTHCSFSCGCLLVKMASETVIRPIKYAIELTRPQLIKENGLFNDIRPSPCTRIR